MDWLAACIAQRVVGDVFFISSGVGVQFAQSSSKWEEARADTCRNVPNPADQKEARKIGHVTNIIKPT